jgi:DNA invertase Pin-like site-specific DNA recombinase
VAISYLRFSNPNQARGASLRRQARLRDAWLKRNKVRLDTSVVLRPDQGVSAFTGEHRTNPDRHALAEFLFLVKEGKVQKGTYLIVENLDRLSREHIIPALSLFLELLQAGVRIVQLIPVEMVYDVKTANPMQVMMAIMELSRGHEESAVKSDRVSDAWREKRGKAVADGTPLTAQVPGWLRLVDGKFEVLEGAAAAVRQIFLWAVEGHGLGVITKRLNGGDFPLIGRTPHWTRSYVASILRSRATLGEYQPHVGRGRARHPVGKPIANYFPAVLSEAQWNEAQAAVSSRRNWSGRLGTAPLNVFAGMVHDARGGGPMHRVDKKRGDGGRRLMSYKALQGIGARVSFSFDVFERAILGRLREVDPRQIVPGKDRSKEKVLSLSEQLGGARAHLERLKAKMLDSPDLDALVEVVEVQEGRCKALAARLAEAEQEAASPALAAWGECRSLIDVLDKAPDPAAARARLRAVIRRLVAGIWVVVVPRRGCRLAAVQLRFRDGKDQHRDYIIAHWARRSRGTWEVLSATAGLGTLDIRKPKHAQQLERALLALDLPR